MKCEVISIGDEILIGQTLNTNAAWLGEKLGGIGVEVRWISAVGDDAADIAQAVDVALGRANVVITTGGLGPTHDDITKAVLTDYFGGGYTVRPEILERLRMAFARRGVEMPKVNEDQARVPAEAEIVPNPVGSAPGFVFRRDDKMVIVLPGVPSEMKVMMDATILPMLRSASGGRHILHRTLHTTGIPESSLFERIGDLRQIFHLVRVAFLPRVPGVDIRLTADAPTMEEASQRLKESADWLIPRLGPHFYGSDEDSLESVVAGLLIGERLTLAVAESCTGGQLSNRLTNVPGSSAYFERGLVTYSNQAKIDLLGVPAAVISEHGAVSAETAEAMARGVRERSATDLGLSTTGIAGPSGGTPEKPVGLIYVGVADRHRSRFERHNLWRDRLLNKQRGAYAALDLLRRWLTESEGLLR